MNKTEAKAILIAELDRFRTMPYADLIASVGGTAYTCERVGASGQTYVVSVAEGAFCDFANFRRLAFCGPTKFGVSRWARHAV
jgi:hypothetical protein